MWTTQKHRRMDKIEQKQYPIWSWIIFGVFFCLERRIWLAKCNLAHTQTSNGFVDFTLPRLLSISRAPRLDISLSSSQWSTSASGIIDWVLLQLSALLSFDNQHTMQSWINTRVSNLYASGNVHYSKKHIWWDCFFCGFPCLYSELCVISICIVWRWSV